MQRHDTTAFPLCLNQIDRRMLLFFLYISSFRCKSTVNCRALLPLTFALTHSAFGTPVKSAFQGTNALLETRKAVDLGERPSGSAAIAQLREHIVAKLKPLSGQTQIDSFQGQTPAGPITMVNVIEKFPGSSGKAIVISGHYDTKKIPMIRFVGANDGGSSTGFLLEFARVLSMTKHQDDLYVVFFDGEEAVGEWSNTDSRYGSQHLASKWLADGVLQKIRAWVIGKNRNGFD